jgi:SAM-dependent MidA family methyltransferase
MDVDPQIRRTPAPDIASVASDPELAARIEAEIERDGPMTFARFMELALYDPSGGYYRADAARPGRQGDFLTAPEASPIFGRAVARHLNDVWIALDRPHRLTVVEHGAGTGALAAGLLDGVRRIGGALAEAVRYRPVEVDDRRLARLSERLGAAGLAEWLDPDAPSPVVGLVLANEVLDALPTHRVVVRQGRLREVHVGIAKGAFVDVERAPSTPDLEGRLAAEGVALEEGQQAEISLALDGWIASAAGSLERGELLLIDYGHPAAELYDPRRRPRGTLLGYIRHVARDDPYAAIGRQDLTAHVDVTAVERAAARAGLDHLATTTQSRFLAGLGAGEILVEMQEPGPEGAAQTFERYLEARAALVRMIDPAVMGRFRVMAFGRGLDAVATLRGLE